MDVATGGMYRGYYVTIARNGLRVIARKYDDENEMLVQKGLQKNDTASISVLREIAKQLFGINKLKLLTSENPPYKEI